MRLRGTNRNFRRVSNQQVPFNPMKLFRNGEQGVHYDPSDFSRYTQLGAETVSNGTFDDGVTGWVQALGSISAVGGRLRAARSADGASAGRAYTAIQCVPGKTYLFKVERYKAQTGSTTVRIGVLANGSSVGAVQQDTSAVDGLYRTAFIATQAEHYVHLESGSGTSGQYAEFDNVSVQELTAIESCTLFQDSAGTTPVTAVEQPVGLMLDKRLGLVRGPELAGQTSNTLNNTASPSFDNLSGYTFSNTTDKVSVGFDGAAIQVELGKTYRITVIGTVVSGTVGISLRAGGALGTPRYSQANVTAGRNTWSIVFTSLYSEILVLRFSSATGNGPTTYTLISRSVRELPGNHAFQTTAIDRPVLRNRYNLLTKTEQISDAIWTKEVSGTGVAATVTDNYAVGPVAGMTASRVQMTVGAGVAAGDWTSLRQSTTVQVGVQNKPRVWLKTADGSTKIVQLRDDSANAAYAVLVTVTGTWTAFSPAVTASINTTGVFRIWLRPALGTSGSADILMAGASLTPADQSTLPYQRVNTSTDYDADPTKFPLYLAANGTNTWMQTNSIDFTATDKVTVVAGVRKLSDAGFGIIAETGLSTDVTPGTFSVFSRNQPGYTFVTFGSSRGAASVSTGFPSPDSAVLSGVGNIAADTAILRRNGSQIATGALDQGTGNYGNYPLFLFRRAGTSLPFNGNFYGLLIRGALTSDPDTLKMERWLSLKTGVQL